MNSKTSIRLSNGQNMPIIGLGTGLPIPPGEKVMQNAVRIAIEAGYRSIDTAYLYECEDAIGEALQELFSQGKLKREDVFITSKLPAIANRAEDVSRFLTMTLKNLRLDYLDQYLIHHPFGLKYFDDNNIFGVNPEGVQEIDPNTDHESLWRALEKEVKSGRVKGLGLSNFNSQQIDRIMKFAEYPPVVNQIEIHAYLQQHPLTEFCQERGIAVVGFCPLGGSWTSEGKTMALLQDPTISKIAKKYGRTTAQILLRNLMQRDIIVIPKSTNSERIISNFDVMGFELTEAEMDVISKLDRGEEGRILHFKEVFKGCENHKEYPFNISF